MRTIKCVNCQQGNTVDSKFCRQCGAGLPADSVDAIKQENAQLVADGLRLLADGRLPEARLVAETVLESDPSSAQALALLGDCYEKDQMFEEAVACYEQALEIEPDSALDRIRLAQLRKAASAQDLAVEQPTDRRRGIAVAALAGVLLLSVGTALALTTQSSVAATTPDTVAGSPDIKGFRTYSPPPMVPNTPSTTGGNGAVTAPADPNGTLPQPGGRELRGQNTIGYAGPTTRDQGVPPYNPVPNGTVLQPTNPGGQGGNTSTGTDPSGSGFEPGGGTETKTDDPGIIEISVNNGNSGPGKVDGGQPADDKSADVLVAKARNLSAQGDHLGAAAAYEQAIRAGAAGGATYQRLAQCYERAGRKSQAIAAYNKAIASYERQVASGQGGSRAQTALDACRRAVSALGG